MCINIGSEMIIIKKDPEEYFLEYENWLTLIKSNLFFFLFLIEKRIGINNFLDGFTHLSGQRS